MKDNAVLIENEMSENIIFQLKKQNKLLKMKVYNIMKPKSNVNQTWRGEGSKSFELVNKEKVIDQLHQPLHKELSNAH